MPLHDENVTVWCGDSAKTVIEPFFFQNENGHAVTVNQERYSDMMTNFLMPIIRRKRMRQDGAPPHTSRVTIDFLKKLFPGRLMSKSGDLDWPHSRYSGRNVGENDGKCCKKGTKRHQRQRRPFERYHIQKLM